MNDARPATPNRPGRKRSEDGRAAILTAAWELTVELGYPGLTVEGIAARAGTGKQTVYRWWPSKADVLFDALAHKADLHVSLEDQGSYRADLEAFLRSTFALARRPSVAGVLRTLMAQAQIDPDFGARFREHFLARRRDALDVLVARAHGRGDFPDRQPGLDTRVVFGVLWYELLAMPPTGTSAGDRVIADLVTLLAAKPGA